MTWSQIWQTVHALLTGLNDAAHWKLSVDGAAVPGPTLARIQESGACFEFDQAGRTVRLDALPGTSDHAVVRVDGKVVTDARLVFSIRHQLTKPLIVVFEFKGVTIGGVTHRYRFDNPR